VRKNSRTKELAQYALNKLQGNVEEINLDFEKIEPLYEDRLNLRDGLIKDKNLKVILSLMPSQSYETTMPLSFIW
jgi:hypothetical protein